MKGQYYDNGTLTRDLTPRLLRNFSPSVELHPRPAHMLDAVADLPIPTPIPAVDPKNKDNKTIWEQHLASKKASEHNAPESPSECWVVDCWERLCSERVGKRGVRMDEDDSKRSCRLKKEGTRHLLCVAVRVCLNEKMRVDWGGPDRLLNSLLTCACTTPALTPNMPPLLQPLPVV